MSEVFGITTRLTIQNVIDVAVGSAFIAICAEFPPNCPAGRPGETAELTFCVGGWFADCHRNGTNAAEGSLITAAVQLGVPSLSLQYVFYRNLTGRLHTAIEKMLSFRYIHYRTKVHLLSIATNLCKIQSNVTRNKLFYEESRTQMRLKMIFRLN